MKAECDECSAFSFCAFAGFCFDAAFSHMLLRFSLQRFLQASLLVLFGWSTAAGAACVKNVGFRFEAKFPAQDSLSPLFFHVPNHFF